jgi:hypothetical protein
VHGHPTSGDPSPEIVLDGIQLGVELQLEGEIGDKAVKSGGMGKIGVRQLVTSPDRLPRHPRVQI